VGMKVWTAIKKQIRENLPLMIVALLIVLFVVVYFWSSIFITIQAGEGGVLYRRFFGGTVVDKIYHEGFHVIAPWDTMTKYNVRYQVIHHQMTALTRKGMKIEIDLTIRYMPEYRLLGVLHQRIGPDYPDKIVTPEAEAVIRKIIGQFDAEEVYSTKRALIQKIVDEAITQVAQRYVRIDDMIITKVELPQTIRVAIEAKLEQRELSLAYEFKLERETKEADRKRIEAQGLHDYNKIVGASLSDRILTWRGVQATLDLARSNNAKVVVIGAGKDGLPLILDTKDWSAPAQGQDLSADPVAPVESGSTKTTDESAP
jgi:regulator of protease activity HflC (stomatin/prohibitin superfamily)